MQAVAGDFYATARTPDTLHIVVALRPGSQSRVWFVSSTRAGDAKDLDPLRKKLEAVTPMEVKQGPVAFVISTKIAGGGAETEKPVDAKDYQPSIPREWTDAARGVKTKIVLPDGFLDLAWPAAK